MDAFGGEIRPISPKNGEKKKHEEVLYTIHFDRLPSGKKIGENTQIKTEFERWGVSFNSGNSVPTVIRGSDLSDLLGKYISKYSGAASTGIILILLCLPIYMVIKYATIKGEDLDPKNFFSKDDVSTIQQKKMSLFDWDGSFIPDGEGYTLDRDTKLYEVLSSVNYEAAKDKNSLIDYCTDKIEEIFDTLENSFSDVFTVLGLTALSLGLLGTVIGMINAFDVLEGTVKAGQGPAQTQLRMTHYINFALVTTVIGFIGRIIALTLAKKIKRYTAERKGQMIDVIRWFNPAINGDRGK